MKHVIGLALSVSFIQIANAQTGKENVIVRSIHSPSREEQSAKADLLLIDRKKIFEPAQIKNQRHSLKKKSKRKH